MVVCVCVCVCIYIRGVMVHKIHGSVRCGSVHFQYRKKKKWQRNFLYLIFNYIFIKTNIIKYDIFLTLSNMEL